MDLNLYTTLYTRVYEHFIMSTINCVSTVGPMSMLDCVLQRQAKVKGCKNGYHANTKNYHCYIRHLEQYLLFKVPYYNRYKKLTCTLTALDHNIGEQFVTKSKCIVCKHFPVINGTMIA